MNVVVDKTLEQSLLEVEEETELQNVEKFKKECEIWSHQENEEWVLEIKSELKKNNEKNQLLELNREQRASLTAVTHKL